MERELVGNSLSGQDDMGTDDSPHMPTYREIFEREFPAYLSIGMTPSQYWDEDCMLVKYYRKAYNLQMEREANLRNQTAWLHGAYIYHALVQVSPLLRPFSKAKEPGKYTDRPDNLSLKHTDNTTAKLEPAKPKMSADAAAFHAWSLAFNRKKKTSTTNTETMQGGDDSDGYGNRQA